MTQTPSFVTVRLSSDAMHLEALLAPEAVAMSRELLAGMLRQRSAALGVDLPLTSAEVDERLRGHVAGTWFTLLSGIAATAPVDGRVELLVPVPVALHAASDDRGASWPAALQGMRHAVRAYTPLARLHSGSTGAPGRDLLGRAVTPRSPRAARLPRGHNTIVGDDGVTLLAACDGEVRLTNLSIDVVPMAVHDGDLTAASPSLNVSGAVFVTGSVRGGRIVAGGDVYVRGEVEEGQVCSAAGSIAVGGGVTGTPQRPSLLRAAADVSCGHVLHAELHAGRSIYLSATARLSVLRAEGDLYLHSVEKDLLETHLHLGGGLVPLLEMPSPLVAVPTDRQHFRVAVTCDALLALHGASPLRFERCTIVDLSTSGVRCRVRGGEPRPGTIMQLKFALPGESDQILVIARMSRWIASGVIGLSFLHMTQRDQERLKMYCVRLLMERSHSKLSSRQDRARGEG